MRHCQTKVCRTISGFDAASAKSCDFRVGGIVCAADDRASVTHALAGGRGASGNECCDWFFHVRLNPLGGIGFIGPADFANENHTVGCRVVVEHRKEFDEVETLHRVATNAHASGLTNAAGRTLPDRFVGQSARATDDADCFAGGSVFRCGVNVTGHDPDFATAVELRRRPFARNALARGNDARAVWPDQNRLGVVAQLRLDARHVLYGNAFGNCTDDANARGGSFENRVSSKGRRYENHRRVGLRRVNCLLHRIENGQTVGIADPAAAWRYAPDHLGAVVHSAFGMKSASGASDALAKDLRRTVNKNRHRRGRITIRRTMRAMPRTKTTPTQQKPEGMTYAAAGVDIDAGERVVDLIKPALRRTHGARVMGTHGAFAGMFRLDFNEQIFKRNYRDPVLVACTDGVGTKVKLAAQLGIINTVGIDCVAMNVNDLIVQGAEPLFFLDYLGLSRIDPPETAAIIEGVARGCEIAGCALIGGECAEMPDIYEAGDFDIAGFSVGVVELARAIDSMRVEPGDLIIGLRSSGVHSNGFSLVRKVIDYAGIELGTVYDELEDDRPFGEVLLEPTRIYAKPIVQLLASYRVKKVVSGMAHITGGGLPGNINRALHDKVDAVVDLKSWEVPVLFNFLQEQGGIATEEMFRVFNMGIGYTLTVRPTFADAVMRKLSKAGEEPILLGRITKGRGRVKFK